ncbi:MAG: bifunctional 4-hydroxy-3-methylbut-2-enyl diphosphate reductase/30S ribosomal protein S1 [Bacillota bacterium]|nr:bifunctional 4-hydroxy-3-methylbut-2-enyl diphosphate reductase/30S ribosomal protein S1 [Bacillota bacterium]
MKVLLARHFGFCFGVERAVHMAREAAGRGPLASLGPLIHNRRVVAELEAAGVRCVSALDDVEGTVIFRTHGVGPSLYEEARRRGLEVLDATCPFVRRAREEALRLAEQGYRVLVVGDPSHPEIQALVEWLQGRATVVRGPEEIGDLPAAGRVGLVAQTTLPAGVLESVATALRERGAEVRVANTICTATAQRQQAAREVAAQSDLVLVVGDRGSANTRRLLEIARETGCATHLVQGADEIDAGWLREVDTVGIVAGASTPEWAIKEVVAKVQELGGEDRKELEGVSEQAAGLEATLLTEREPATQVASLAQEEVPEATEEPGAPDVEAEDVTVQGEAPVADAAAEAPAEGEAADAAAEAPAEGEVAVVEDEAVLLEESLALLQPGDLVQGRVMEVTPEGVLVDVGYKSEGIIPLGELARRRFNSPEEIVRPGDEITVYVLSVDNQEQVLKLSKKRADEILAWDGLKQARDEGRVLEAEVIQEVKGGLVVDVGLRGFVPASQIERGYVQDLSKYVGKKLRLKVIELERSKGRCILSQRVVLEEERRRKREQTWATIAEGQILTGTVKSLTDFGAFIDVGGVDGLLHVSEMSWGRVNHPSEVLQVGQEVNVMVLRLDREKGKISLGLKQTMSDPWQSVQERYPVGSVVTGRVTRLAPFGAFVELEPGVEGLVHLSELSSDRVSRADEVLNVGEEVKVKVLRVRSHDRRIGLSLRQVLQDQERAEIKRFLSSGNTAPLSTAVSEVLNNKESH